MGAPGGHDAPAGRVSARTSRPGRSRPARDKAGKTQVTKRPAAARRPAAPARKASPARRPAARRGGGFLNTFIVALLVVLTVMAAMFLVYVVRVFG